MPALHPTKEALIQSVVGMLGDQAPAEITIESVLEKSGISRGSLYHHFEDFQELIESAQIRRYAAYVDGSIEILAKILQGAKTRDEMAHLIREVTRGTQSMQANRFDRALTIAAAIPFQRMRKTLGLEQARLTEAISDLYREVLERGWGNPKIDPETVGLFIQAYTFGKVVDDFGETHVDPDKWLDLITMILETLIFPPIK